MQTQQTRQTGDSHRPQYTVPGVSEDTASQVMEILDGRLVSLIDLSLTLKHIHWNVVGPNFIGIHEMLDPQVEEVREMVDVVAERIATLGGEPIGTPGAVSSRRTWDDYSLGRATAIEHLAALEVTYRDIIRDHRAAQQRLSEIDPVSEDVMIEQLRRLELFQWFVRAHLESSSGELLVSSDTEAEAAEEARSRIA